MDSLSDKTPLPLTDENQRLVNLKLLRLIYQYQEGGVTGLYDHLVPSMKRDGDKIILSKDGMRKAVQRDRGELEKLAGNGDPKDLHGWLKKKKKSPMLQVRITPNQFLLNNILSLLGISFESLFDKAQLPGAADEPVFDTDLSGKEETGKKDRDLLLQINDKLDKILLKQDRGRTYRRFSKHFSELMEYIYFLRYIFDYTYDMPCENGFSFQKGDKSQELSAKQIYSTNYYFISWQIKKLHGRDKIHRSFANMATCKNNTYEFGRLASPFFILALLLHLLINLMNSGIINKKAIFQIFSENISSNLFKTTEHDNKTASDLFKNAYTETSHVIQNIQNIQKKELNVTNELCVKCEKLCVNFFNNTEKLFSNLIPIQFRINDILNNINTRIELERKLEDSFGTIATFGIQQGWLDYLDKYIEDMGEFQISLGKYYVENEEAISK